MRMIISYFTNSGNEVQEDGLLIEDKVIIGEVTEPVAMTIVSETLLLAVADGVPVSRAGAKATKVVLEFLRGFYKQEGLHSKTIEKVQQKMAREYSHTKYNGMATTLGCVELTPLGLKVANAGDCEVFKITKGKIETCSKKHTFAEELSDEYALSDSLTSMLVAGYGEESALITHTASYRYDNEMILLCTDGLMDAITKDELLDNYDPDPAIMADNLFSLIEENLKTNTTFIFARNTQPPCESNTAMRKANMSLTQRAVCEDEFLLWDIPAGMKRFFQSSTNISSEEALEYVMNYRKEDPIKEAVYAFYYKYYEKTYFKPHLIFIITRCFDDPDLICTILSDTQHATLVAYYGADFEEEEIEEDLSDIIREHYLKKNDPQSLNVVIGLLHFLKKYYSEKDVAGFFLSVGDISTWELTLKEFQRRGRRIDMKQVPLSLDNLCHEVCRQSRYYMKTSLRRRFKYKHQYLNACGVFGEMRYILPKTGYELLQWDRELANRVFDLHYEWIHAKAAIVYGVFWGERLVETVEFVGKKLRHRAQNRNLPAVFRWINEKLLTKEHQMKIDTMVKSISKADIVVTVGSECAVGLYFNKDEGDNAPKVVIKGRDHIAQKIIDAAIEDKIQIYEDRNLAFELYRKVEIADEIPPELYGAVAEVLAIVYKTNNKQKDNS